MINFKYFDMWRKVEQTDIKTVEEFLNKYCKHERYKGRGQDYADTVLNSAKESLKNKGNTILSRHESVTGQVVAFYRELTSEEQKELKKYNETN